MIFRIASIFISMMIGFSANAGHFVEDGGGGSTHTSIRDYLSQAKPLRMDEVPGMSKLLELLGATSFDDYTRLQQMLLVYPSQSLPYYRLDENAARGPAKNLIQKAKCEDRGHSEMPALNMSSVGLQGVLLLPSFHQGLTENEQAAALYAATLRGPPPYDYDEIRRLVLRYLEDPHDPGISYEFYKVLIASTDEVSFLLASEKFDRAHGFSKSNFAEVFGEKLGRCLLAKKFRSIRECKEQGMTSTPARTDSLLSRAIQEGIRSVWVDSRKIENLENLEGNRYHQLSFRVRPQSGSLDPVFQVELFLQDRSLGTFHFENE